jgi:hypothetical protein
VKFPAWPLSLCSRELSLSTAPTGVPSAEAAIL